MKPAYLVVEGESDADILKRLLPADLVAATQFVPAQGRGSALSLAGSLLADRMRPVALVVDAETDMPLVVREREEYLRYMLRQVSGDTPFEVFVAAPEIESVFVADRDVCRQLLGENLTDAEWEAAEARPKARLMAKFLSLENLLASLSPPLIQALREHPIISGLIRFLSSVTECPVAAAAPRGG